MLDLLSSGVFSLWLRVAGVSPAADPTHLVVWQNAPMLWSPNDAIAQMRTRQYLEQLTRRGLESNVQGIWLQAGPFLLANHHGTEPFPAASLTKVATSLAALDAWGPQHQFETVISVTGPIHNGTLRGDLVIRGGGDPLLVWEEAIAIGNALNQMGIQRVKGNLLITGKFSMNFETERKKSGELFRQAIHAKFWNQEVEAQYRTLPAGTAKPNVAIEGFVMVMPQGEPVEQTELLRHKSLPLVQILKLMNIYSNNVVSQSLADSLGGAAVVAARTAELTGVPAEEILLQNGSGLGVDNRLSPRAVCAMFAALHHYTQMHNLSLADLFPIAGQDKGTIEERKIPRAAVVKTGTLNTVSALAGALPTRDRGLLWFAIINRGSDIEDLRQQQDRLLQLLVSQWGTASPLPIAVVPTAPIHAAKGIVGDRQRIQAVQTAAETWMYQQ